MADFAEKLERELEWRYNECEDFAATPSSILLDVLNAVAEARKEGPSSGDRYPQDSASPQPAPATCNHVRVDETWERKADGKSARRIANKCHDCGKIFPNEKGIFNVAPPAEPQPLDGLPMYEDVPQDVPFIGGIRREPQPAAAKCPRCDHAEHYGRLCANGHPERGCACRGERRVAERRPRR